MDAQEAQPDDGEDLATSMTRPEMFFGFPLTSLAFGIFAPAALALLTKEPLLFLLVPFTLTACYLVILKDIYFFDILFAALNLKSCRNARIWGCRRYAAR